MVKEQILKEEIREYVREPNTTFDNISVHEKADLDFITVDLQDLEKRNQLKSHCRC